MTTLQSNKKGKPDPHNALPSTKAAKHKTISEVLRGKKRQKKTEKQKHLTELQHSNTIRLKRKTTQRRNIPNLTKHRGKGRTHSNTHSNTHTRTHSDTHTQRHTLRKYFGEAAISTPPGLFLCLSAARKCEAAASPLPGPASRRNDH